MLTLIAVGLNGVVSGRSLPPGTVRLDGFVLCGPLAPGAVGINRLVFGDSLAPSAVRLDGFVLGGPLTPGAVRINALVDGFYQSSSITGLYRTNAGFSNSFCAVSCARLFNSSHVCSATKNKYLLELRLGMTESWQPERRKSTKNTASHLILRCQDLEPRLGRLNKSICQCTRRTCS